MASCRDNPIDLRPEDSARAQTPQPSMLASGSDGALNPFPDLIDIVAPLSRDLPPQPRAYEASDQALIEAVRDAGAVVFIGFKPEGAQRTRVSGIMPGIRKPDAMEWRTAIEARGVSIIQTFRNSATVVASIQPESAPDLASLPFVNFVEPVGGRTV
jgi:hypothetical protein